MVSREVVKEVKTLYGNLISVQGVYVKRAFTRKANLKIFISSIFLPTQIKRKLLNKVAEA